MSLHENLKKNYELFKQHAEEDLNNVLYSKEIISHRTKEKIDAKMKNEGRTVGTEVLWTELLHCTEQDLEKFVDILRAGPSNGHKTLANALQPPSLKAAGNTKGNQDHRYLLALSERFSKEYLSIGLELNISHDRLKQMQHDNPRDSVSRNYDMLMDFWQVDMSRSEKISKLKQAFRAARRNDISGDISDMFNS